MYIYISVYIYIYLYMYIYNIYVLYISKHIHGYPLTFTGLYISMYSGICMCSKQTVSADR